MYLLGVLLSVCLSNFPSSRYTLLQQICCCGPGEMSIDSGGYWALMQLHVAQQCGMWWLNVGTVTLSAVIGIWTCLTQHNAVVVLKSTQHEMMLMTQHWPDKSSHIVCIQNLPISCSQEDIIDLLNSMFHC